MAMDSIRCDGADSDADAGNAGCLNRCGGADAGADAVDDVNDVNDVDVAVSFCAFVV